MPLRGTTDDENRPFSRESAMALRATVAPHSTVDEQVRWGVGLTQSGSIGHPKVTQPLHPVTWRTLMDPRRQCCHTPDCSERGVVGGGNIVIHSRAEQRYQCRRCKRT